jgi:GNAT superfamily N-acetyltransferase
MSREALSIREAKLDDVSVIKPLLFQLGYDLSETEIRRRMEFAIADQAHFLIIGESSAEVAAFMHCYLRPSIDKPYELVVQALVVEETRRSLGAGAQMMEEAERLARVNHCDSVTLSSHETRYDAHRFYAALGYQHFATSAHFRKTAQK